MLFINYTKLSRASTDQQNNNSLQFTILHQTLHINVGEWSGVGCVWHSVTCMYFQVVVVLVQFTSVYYTAAVATQLAHELPANRGEKSTC